MWTDGAAITKQLSDEDIERAARRGMRRSFLDDLEPDARERLEEIRGEIDRGEVAFRRSPRDGRPATDEERRRIHRRRDPMRPQSREHSKADRIAEALRSRPGESYVEIAASIGVSHSYLKQVARSEGIHRPKGARAKAKPRAPKPRLKRSSAGGPTRDDRLYLAWGLLHGSRASYEAIGHATGLSVQVVRTVALRCGVERHAGRKPKVPVVRRRRRILSVADDRLEARRPRPIARDDPARAQGAA